MKVNFAFCGLFRTVCIFFRSERKVSQGFQNHKLSVQMKKIGRMFLTHMLSENIFSFWAEKLAFLAKNYRHGCQNRNLRIFKNFWGKTVFFWTRLQTSSDFEMKKRAFSKKVFFRYFTAGIRASREMSWGKKISLSKKLYFPVIIFGVWMIYLSLLQNSLVRCVKPAISVRREQNCGN